MKWSYLIKKGFPEKGQGLIEYALILVLVAIVVIAILLLLGPQIGNVFSQVAARLDTSDDTGGDGTFSVNSVSVTGYGNNFANWSAPCSVGGCTVTVTCTFYNHAGQQKDTVTSSNSQCSIFPDDYARKVIIQVTNASAPGYTWDGSVPPSVCQAWGGGSPC